MVTKRDSGFELRWTGGRLGDAVADCVAGLARLDLPERDGRRLAVLIEELLANQYDHGADGDPAILAVRVTRNADHVLLVMEDAGAAFDPRAAAADTPISDRGGGAGLALVRAWADSLAYLPGPPINRLELRYGLSVDP